VELEIPKEVSYEPGDHVAIFVENELETHVERILHRLGLQLSTKPVQVELLEEMNNIGMKSSVFRVKFLP
jgi:sulfite reductase alpha subunit-like flavoprotein